MQSGATFPARRQLSAPKKVAMSSNATRPQEPAFRVALGVAAWSRLAATCVLVALGWELLSMQGFEPAGPLELRKLLAVLAVSVGAALLAYGLVEAGRRSAPWCKRATPRSVRRVVSLRAVVQRASGAMLFGGLFACGIVLEGGDPSALLQLTAAMMMCGVVGGGLWLSDGPRACVLLLAAVCGRRVSDRDDAAQFVSMSRRGRRLAWTAGLLTVTMGVVHVLSVLDQPKLIGPGLAVALVGLVWGAVLAELGFGAAERWFEVARALPVPERDSAVERLRQERREVFSESADVAVAPRELNVGASLDAHDHRDVVSDGTDRSVAAVEPGEDQLVNQ
jgi:hypothetical protein